MASAGTAPLETAESAELVDLTELRRLAEATRPTALAAERRLPVLEPLEQIFPLGGLARGSTVGVSGPGSTSLGLAVSAGSSQAGGWVGFVGVDSVGWGAASGFGLDLSRTAVVPDVPTGQWSTVCAALLDALDVVVVAPSHMVKATAARRLVARGRERGSVLLVLGTPRRWPTGLDLTLDVGSGTWFGLGRGHGHLTSRRVTVGVGGRRASSRRHQIDLWLPTITGEVAAVEVTPQSGRRLRAV